MKKVSGILSVIMMVLAACSPAEVSYSVQNHSANKIFVNYTPFSTNDTQVVGIGADTLVTLLETENSSGKTNWFFDYKLHINSVYNVLGDTLLINPNVSQYWILYSGDPLYQYKLEVKDTDF